MKGPEFYKHNGSVPMVGEMCAVSEDRFRQEVKVIALVSHDVTYVVYVGWPAEWRPDIQRLDWFNNKYKYREVQP